MVHTLNLILAFFDGDVDKAFDWYQEKNPDLGNVSPIHMMKHGRGDMLRKWVLDQMSGNRYKTSSGKKMAKYLKYQNGI